MSRAGAFAGELVVVALLGVLTLAGVLMWRRTGLALWFDAGLALCS